MELKSESKSATHSINMPSGFRFGSTACGIKSNGELDLSVLVADKPCLTMGMFTKNLVRASSVDWNESRVGRGAALVVNSGNANACTGTKGKEDTATMAAETAQHLGCQIDEVAVMSTGIIGEPLPMDKVKLGIEKSVLNLGSDDESLDGFATGILTTDSSTKVRSVEFQVGDRAYSILGVAKGAGMIGPRMATMLCVLITDFPLTSQTIQSKEDGIEVGFRQIIDRTFNSISVDGHTSTSDQVLIFAPETQDEADVSAGSSPFLESLERVCTDLAKLIPADGEGAQHLIEIKVQGAFPESDLKSVAKTIADSPLVKTAVFGGDPNWGRIVSAAGYNGLGFDLAQTSLRVNDHLLFEEGEPVEFDPEDVSNSIKNNFETRILLRLGGGQTSEKENLACYWTSDLTYDYVKINAEYHT